MTSKKGYTLLELLVVIALFSLVLSIALPRGNLYAAYLEKTELRELKSDLLYCRNKAIVENRIYVVYFSRNDCYQIRLNSQVIKRKELKTLNVSGLKEIRYTATGVPTQAGSLDVSGKRKNYTITISPITGGIRINEE